MSIEAKPGRRTFLQTIAYSSVALGGAGLISGDQRKRVLEAVDTDGPLFKSSQLELRTSPFMNGVVDILDTNGRIVNNLIPIVCWYDPEYNTYFFNNAEIQGAPLAAFIDVTGQNNLLILKYRFHNYEWRPNMTPYPPSDVEIELQIGDGRDGSVDIRPTFTMRNSELRNLVIGLGCFFGVNHGTIRCDVETDKGLVSVTPWPLMQPVTYGEFDEPYTISRTARSFELTSAYVSMPNVKLSIQKPDLIEKIFFPASSNADMVIGLRDAPWSRSHNGLYRQLSQETGRKEWIESAILYAKSAYPNYNLQLG